MLKIVIKKRKNSQLKKKFEIMLSEGGVLDTLKCRAQDLYQKIESRDKDIFVLLEDTLVIVCELQDKYRKLINKMIGFYGENQEVSLHLLPLFLSIQKLGKDKFKEGQDITIVCNKALVHEQVAKRHILLYTDYYGHVPQPLNFIKRQKKQPSSFPNEVVVRELEDRLPVLLKENLFKIYDSIESLQQMVLNN